MSVSFYRGKDTHKKRNPQKLFSQSPLFFSEWHAVATKIYEIETSGNARHRRKASVTGMKTLQMTQ
jgi:hypothetical protein